MKYKFLFLVFLLMPIMVEASASTSLSNSRTSAIVGQRITTTVRVSLPSSYDACSWEFTLNYDQARLNFSPVSGTRDSSLVIDAGATNRSYEYKFSFLARSSGSANISVSPSAMYCAKGDADEVLVTFPSRSSSVTIRTQAEYEASLSSNNFLKSLTVEDNQLEPDFDKEILEYQVILEPETTKINVLGVLDDNTASVEGLGEYQVDLGANEITIVVTAQNGTKRTYTINAMVMELDPIILTINDKEYTVLRKSEQVFCPLLFELDEMVYEDEIISVCYNEQNDLTLLALIDPTGETVFFIYDDLIEYQWLTLLDFVFMPKPFPNDLTVNEAIAEVVLKINGRDVNAWRLTDKDNLYLIYGMNVRTSQEGLYQYDSEEVTLQRYLEKEEKKEETNNLFLIISAILAITFFISTTLLILQIKQIKEKVKIAEKIVAKKDLHK